MKLPDRLVQQREALELSVGGWKTDDHPELAGGGAAYVDQIRSEPDTRFEAALENQGRCSGATPQDGERSPLRPI
jgi:hypothetical protein